jgi:hypothetical protein
VDAVDDAAVHRYAGGDGSDDGNAHQHPHHAQAAKIAQLTGPAEEKILGSVVHGEAPPGFAMIMGYYSTKKGICEEKYAIALEKFSFFRYIYLKLIATS